MRSWPILLGRWLFGSRNNDGHPRATNLRSIIKSEARRTRHGRLSLPCWSCGKARMPISRCKKTPCGSRLDSDGIRFRAEFPLHINGWGARRRKRLDHSDTQSLLRGTIRKTTAQSHWFLPVVLCTSGPQIKSPSPRHRFVIALHSPKGVAETGLLICPSEKKARKLARDVKSDTFSGPLRRQLSRICGGFLCIADCCGGAGSPLTGGNLTGGNF